MQRRDFLAATGAALGQTLDAQTRRPNILFIMVDEMRWDALHCHGHPVVDTPNLDRLAKQGVRFTNAYTVAPVCSPSRACTFTGRYADVNGVITNALPANDGEIFLPSVLKHYGYHTAISGKLHYAPRGYSFGFDQFWSFSAEGPAPELGLNAHIQRKYGKGARKWDRVDGTCPWPDDELGRDVGVFKYADEDFETEWLTDRSLEYLRSRNGKQQPWFLFTSYLKPHSPSVEPAKWLKKYDPKAIPVPKLPADAKAVRATKRGQQRRHFIDDEQMLRVMSAAYYGAIAHIDQQVGRIFAELDKLGMTDNTLILFTADHGNMLGDRGRFFKGIMYEGSSHVPLIWKGPKGAPENTGRTEEKIVENIDLMPTLLEAVGLPVPERVQGRSFLKLARGKDPQWKDHCFSQLSTAMIRTPQFKFIDNSRNLGADFELYDMRNDPREQRNLVSEARHRDRIESFKRQLTQWRADKPAPIKITGMAVPDYAFLSKQEREEARGATPRDDTAPRRRR